jgi:hypothetical protein
MPNDSVITDNAKLRKIKHHKLVIVVPHIWGHRKRMRVGKDICNNVPKRTKLNAERQRDYKKRKVQEKAQENKTSQVFTSTDLTQTPIIYNYNQ